MTTNQVVSVSDINSGKLRFTPAGSGTATFEFKVKDNGGTADGGIDTDPTPNTLTMYVM